MASLQELSAEDEARLRKELNLDDLSLEGDDDGGDDALGDGDGSGDAAGADGGDEGGGSDLKAKPGETRRERRARRNRAVPLPHCLSAISAQPHRDAAAAARRRSGLTRRR